MRPHTRRWTMLGLVGALLVPTMLSAQTVGSVEGRVVDADSDRPIRGIRVELAGSRGVAITDGDGEYAIQGIAPGVYTARITWYGYQDREAQVTVPAGGTARLDIAMVPAPVALGEILVTTASRQPERVLETPASIDVVPRERVRDVAATGQAPLLLADLAGVTVMQSGVNSFNVSTRGFNTLGPRGLLVLMDGVDMGNPFVGAQEWPVTTVIEAGTQVELVRGPGSALYGANAYNGVVNIRRPAARQMQGTRLTLSGGELSTLGVDGRHAGVFGGLRWGYAVEGGYSRTESFDVARTNTGDLDREYADAVDGTPAGAHPAPGYELVPLLGQSKAEPFGVPGAALGAPDPLTVWRGSARLDHYLTGGGVLSVEGGSARSENQVDGSTIGRAQVIRADRPWGRVALGTERFSAMAYYTGRRGRQLALASGTEFTDESDRLHVEGQAAVDFADERGKAVLGGSFRNDAIDSKGTLFAPRNDGRSDQYYSAFAQVSFELAPGLRGTAAARVDDASLYDAEISPKLGLVWSPAPQHSVRATFGTAYLVPAPAQRFLEVPAAPPVDLSALEAGLRASPLGPALAGVPDGTLLTVSAAVPILAIGNEQLGPEEVRSWEVGYRVQLERVYLAVDGYLNRFRNFQTAVLPGVNPDFAPWTAPPQVDPSAVDAVEAAVRGAVPGITRLGSGNTAVVLSTTEAGRARQWGGELSLGVQATDELLLSGNYSYVTVDFEEGSFLGADSIPANTPSHVANLSAAYTTPGGTRVRVGATLTSSFDFLVGVWQGEVPSRQYVDASASQSIGDALRVGVSVTNVFDQRRFHYFGGSVIGRRLIAFLTWEP